MLIAGTTIGGGMLAAPVLMAGCGFLPSIIVYLICWMVMASTGLLLLEACLWMRRETNIISLANMTLGRWGRMSAWAMYLFLFYCLTLSYVIGGGELVADTVAGGLSTSIGSLVFVAVFGAMVFCGAAVVGIANLPLIFGLAVTYFAFVVLGYRYIDLDLLARRDWSSMFKAFPIAFAAFGFQGTIPTLTTYLDHDARKTRLAIILGTAIPLIVYSVWQGLIIGIVPLEGSGGLAEARANGYLAVRPLKEIIASPHVYVLGQYFAFFALTTSFLGVTLGLLDFLADGLKVEKTVFGRLWLSLLIFVPPIVVAQYYPGIFLDALDLAGGFGVAFLLGVLPVLMVWVGRYHMQLQGQRMLPGGRPLLIILLLVIGLELVLELTKVVSAII